MHKDPPEAGRPFRVVIEAPEFTVIGAEAEGSNQPVTNAGKEEGVPFRFQVVFFKVDYVPVVLGYVIKTELLFIILKRNALTDLGSYSSPGVVTLIINTTPK